MRLGSVVRFCQRCGVAHSLDSFDGDKRSCRRLLQRHNARRRRTPQPSSSPPIETLLPFEGLALSTGSAPALEPTLPDIADMSLLPDLPEEHGLAMDVMERTASCGPCDECVCGAIAGAMECCRASADAAAAAAVPAECMDAAAVAGAECAAPGTPAMGASSGSAAPAADGADGAAVGAAAETDAESRSASPVLPLGEAEVMYAALVHEQLVHAQVLLASAGFLMQSSVPYSMLQTLQA